MSHENGRRKQVNVSEKTEMSYLLENKSNG